MPVHPLLMLGASETHGLTASEAGRFIGDVIVYLYFAICIMKLAKKFRVANPCLAWIPYINIWYACEVAGKPGWWFFALTFPLVNLVFIMQLGKAIAQRAGKPEWLGNFLIVPGVNVVVLAYLAFSKSRKPHCRSQYLR